MIKGNNWNNFSKEKQEEIRKKISKSLRGRKLSEETRRKMSISARKRVERGIKPPLHSMPSEKNPNWKGDKVGYAGLHLWIRRNKPKPTYCEICNKNPPRDVANINGIYNRDIMNYKWLCKKCHRNFDL